MTPRLGPTICLLVLASFVLAVPSASLAKNSDSEVEAQTQSPKASSPANGRSERPGETGSPLPRFASLRANEVNLRTGPGARYPIDWVFKRRGLPVEIIDEFDTWRRIRDWQGTVGWVHQSMLQSQRNVLVTGKRRLLRRGPEEGTAGAALVEVGVVGKLGSCLPDWCEIIAKGFKGWLRRDEFYGIYPSEIRP